VNALVTALNRLIMEKPTVLGVCTQMHGIGVASDPSMPTTGASGYGFDGMAGMVATAASATVSGVVGMMAAGAGLNLQTSAMKIQWYVSFGSTQLHYLM
jgi:hypothetical protein